MFCVLYGYFFHDKTKLYIQVAAVGFWHNEWLIAPSHVISCLSGALRSFLLWPCGFTHGFVASGIQDTGHCELLLLFFPSFLVTMVLETTKLGVSQYKLNFRRLSQRFEMVVCSPDYNLKIIIWEVIYDSCTTWWNNSLVGL